MPKYYQIHRGLENSKVETRFIPNRSFFFSKKILFGIILKKR